jgi:tetratricopeptide (TPR) repeat protein
MTPTSCSPTTTSKAAPTSSSPGGRGNVASPSQRVLNRDAFDVRFRFPKVRHVTPTSPAAARLTQLEAFLRQDPDNAGLLMEAFDAALHAGMADAAEFHLVHATRLGHDAWRWGLNGVHLELARQHWNDAVARADALRQSAALPRELLDALDHATAFARFRQGRWHDAVAALEPLLSRAASTGTPIAPASQALALRLWHHRQQLDDAMAWARSRFDNGTLAPEAAGVASLIALDMGEFETSARWAQSSLASASSCAEALVSTSSLAAAGRDAASGQRFARQALALIPDDGRSWSALGLAQMLEGNLPDARSSFETALRTMPDHVGTWLSLGWVAMLLNDDQAALVAFERGVDCDRNFGEAQGGLAAIQAKLGQRDAALASIERARRLDASGLSYQYAQRLLDGGDATDDHNLLTLARRLLRGRKGPLGGSMADWLPPGDTAAS